MINKIGFQNIRVFADLTEFELKPLTILTGSNNSGKSTMQKMFLLLSTGFEPDGNELQLENLNFKTEIFNKIGDYKSNVNYNSNDDQIYFSFHFEDVLFGDVSAHLTYGCVENSITTAKLVEISFTDSDGALISLKKEWEEFEHNKLEVWKWDIGLLDSYIKKLHKHLLYLKLYSENQEYLNNLDFNLRTKNLIKKSEKDESICKWFKEKGIIFNDERAIQIQKNRHPDIAFPEWNVYNEKTGHVFNRNQTADSVFIDFPFPNDMKFLINTPLIDSIGNDFDKFLNEGDKERESIRIFFLKNGIVNAEKFEEAYFDFEYKCIQVSFFKNFSKTSDDPEYSGHYNAFSINEILDGSTQKEFDLNDMLNDKLFEPNVIAKIITSAKKVENNKDDDNSNSIELTKYLYGSVQRVESDKYKEIRRKSEFEKCYYSIADYFLSFNTSFQQSLQKLLNNTQINRNDSNIKRQYMLGDPDVIDSPFLNFGINFFKEESHIRKRKQEFIDRWLKNLEVSDELKVYEIKIENNMSHQTLGYYYTLISKNKEVPLFDCGSGIHQIVLLLLNITNNISFYPNKTILLEEPETNMHPMLQSKLADLFVEAKNKFKINFIIETHSEYLIRKLQYLTAKNDINTEDVVIYYFNADKHVTTQEPKIKKIEIRENGNLSETFGPGFYDETTRLQFDLMKLNQEQNN